jgi:hypothetical protein
LTPWYRDPHAPQFMDRNLSLAAVAWLVWVGKARKKQKQPVAHDPSCLCPCPQIQMAWWNWPWRRLVPCTRGPGLRLVDLMIFLPLQWCKSNMCWVENLLWVLEFWPCPMLECVVWLSPTMPDSSRESQLPVSHISWEQIQHCTVLLHAVSSQLHEIVNTILRLYCKIGLPLEGFFQL